MFGLLYLVDYVEILGIVEVHEIGRTLLEVLHEVLLVVVLYEVSILDLLVYKILLQSRSLHEEVRKLPPGLRVVILHYRYWSDLLLFYFAF